MKVLDLFSGTGSATEAFRRLGHQVVTVDTLMGAHIRGDILSSVVRVEIAFAAPFDFVWASPPCQAFSVASFSAHWNRDGSPKPSAVHALSLVAAAMDIIKMSGARYWVMENPVGLLRKQSIMESLERRTVTYCRLGDKRKKPTDLWGVFPPGLRLPPPCSNGDSCHEAAPRGAKTGTQGVKGARDRGRVPYALSLLLAMSMTLEQGELGDL